MTWGKLNMGRLCYLRASSWYVPAKCFCCLKSLGTMSTWFFLFLLYKQVPKPFCIFSPTWRNWIGPFDVLGLLLEQDFWFSWLALMDLLTLLIKVLFELPSVIRIVRAHSKALLSFLSVSFSGRHCTIRTDAHLRLNWPLNSCSSSGKWSMQASTLVVQNWLWVCPQLLESWLDSMASSWQSCLWLCRQIRLGLDAAAFCRQLVLLLI